MKTTLLTLTAVGFLMISCGGSGKAEFDAAAAKICDCMSKRSAENAAAAAEDTLGLSIDMTDLDYSLCALDVALDVDPFDEQMGKSIDEKCSDLSETHKKYVDGYQQ